MLKPKIRKISLFDSKGYGNEPSWKDVTSLSDSEYISKTMRAINWYYQLYSRKEGHEWFVAWYANHFPKRKGDIQYINAAKTDKISNLLCALYPMEQQGWVARYSVLKHVVNHLKEVIESGKAKKASVEYNIEDAESVPTLSIQDRIREQSISMSEELDYIIDSFIENPDDFDPKAVKVISLLRGSGSKAVHARFIKSFFKRGHEELLELASGNADEQLKEAYRHHPRKNIKKLTEFYDSIMNSCNQLVGEAKVLRKPRVKKIKPADDLVKKVKYKLIDNDLGIVGITPVNLIGAQTAVVFNSKTRKIGVYYSGSIAGLTVKGASIDNFSEKSIQRTLRKPEEQLKVIKDLNTQRKLENWFNKDITTMATPVTGRLGEDILILKVYK